jgi:hypothetical protein
MFKIGSGRNTWIAVRWNGLAEDGATVENEVDLQVLLVDRARLQEQVRAENEGGSTDAFAREVTQNWRKVGDADGQPLPFNPANFQLLFDSPGFAVAFGSAYGAAWHGQSGIREKNSATSPDAGQPAGEPSPKPAA